MGSQNLLALLPRLDCGLCGYGGCKPYAEAISSGEATIDRCAPGGTVVLKALAHAAGQCIEASLPDMEKRAASPLVANIQSSSCIGCYKCAEVCPVDAVIGAQGRMHEILPSICNGCGLCVPVCPVDCIQLEAADATFNERYALKDFYALCQSHKQDRLKAVHGEKNDHYLHWKSAGKLGKQRRKTYIQKAQQRMQKGVEDEKKQARNAGSLDGGVS